MATAQGVGEEAKGTGGQEGSAQGEEEQGAEAQGAEEEARRSRGEDEREKKRKRIYSSSLGILRTVSYSAR